ncbi:hypothetical protein [Lewinella sp. IMCC34183]|uniref:hypothetical protein n=1 Tax=Lewinella sp. IMCC34183 TaxID=2248762 RepID=UPI000E279FD0|nr:hypothetical protein [Lewinella sp. IMCC34183]
MEQRDLIKEEAERPGNALGKVISQFFKLREETHGEEDVAATDRELVDLDLDPEVLVALSAPELEAYFLDRRLSGPALKPLAHYFYALGHFAPALRVFDLAERDAEALTLGAMTLRTRIARALRGE